MSPLVSVIVTAFNHEEYISQSLLSIINQSYKNIEIIVVNDGSTDRTADRIEELRASHPKLVTFVNNTVNSRPRISGNQGIMIARGEYLAFNDGDDFWEPKKLEKQIKVFEQDKSGSVGLVYTYGRNLIQDPTRSRDEIWCEDPEKDVFTQIFRGAFFFKISMVIPKRLISKIGGGYNERFPFCADYELMLRVAALGVRFASVPEVLVNHRIHPGNETRSREASILNTKEMILDFSKRYTALISKKGIDTDQRLALLDLSLAKDNISSRKYRDARQIYFRVVLKYPQLIFFARSHLVRFFLCFIPGELISQLRRVRIIERLFKPE